MFIRSHSKNQADSLVYGSIGSASSAPIEMELGLETCCRLAGNMAQIKLLYKWNAWNLSLWKSPRVFGCLSAIGARLLAWPTQKLGLVLSRFSRRAVAFPFALAGQKTVCACVKKDNSRGHKSEAKITIFFFRSGERNCACVKRPMKLKVKSLVN